VDARFDALEHEMRSGFADIRRILDRIDTRLAALEMAVFGASSSTGRMSAHSILGRLAKLERAVFKK
jgi:membrane protein required for beta-lactamase induction